MNYEELLKVIEQKAMQIQQYDQVIQIGYTQTIDSIIASSLIARTYYDIKHPFVLFNLDNKVKEQISKRSEYPIVIIGVEPSQVEELDFDRLIAITTPTSKKIEDDRILNAGEFGYNIPDITLTAISYFLCSVFAENKTLPYIIQLPLVAYQSYEMMAPYQGVHKTIAEDAETAEVISKKKHFSIFGSGIFSITEALINSEYPFLPGLSGNETKVTQLLANAGVTVETNEGERQISDLDNDEIKDLNSTLIVHLAQHKGHQEEKLEFIQPKTIITTEEKNTILRNTWDYCQSIKDCINRNQVQIAIAVLLGNRSDKFRKLTKIFKEERRALHLSYQLLVDKQDEVSELKSLRYLETDHKVNWYNASLTAAMGLSHGLVTPELPFAIIAPGPSDLFTIGVRASKQHDLDKDLITIIQNIINERELEKEVLGSQLSAQVSVEKDMVEPILLDLNDIINQSEEKE